MQGLFESLRKKNRIYCGKRFSILGDSISTLDNYNPDGYNVFYAEENCERSGVFRMQDTWWGKVIRYFDGELLVNNSWSGSRVTKLPDKEALFPSGCSDERTSFLHMNVMKPEVIIVYLGTNDWAFGAKTNKDLLFSEDRDEGVFDFAYDKMLKKLKKNYPFSEIWCCTLNETYISKYPDFVFPHVYEGRYIEEYNQIIRETSEKNLCRLIDLYSYKTPYDSIDGIHPTKRGMEIIANMVVQAVMD